MLKGVHRTEAHDDDHGARESVCLRRVFTAALFLCPLAGTRADPAKTVRYRPVDKLLDALSGMLCGAKTIAQNNLTIRTDRAVQQAFGRTGCAEQSTIARTLRACTAENVAQLDKASWYYLSAMERHPATASTTRGCG